MFFGFLLFKMRRNHFADIGACPQIQIYHSAIIDIHVRNLSQIGWNIHKNQNDASERLVKIRPATQLKSGKRGGF